MSTTTKHYGFIKPDKNDLVNIDDLNANFDKIDNELKNRPSSAALVVTISYNSETEEYTTDKWYSEIIQAMDSGVPVVAQFMRSGRLVGYAVPYIREENLIYFQWQTVLFSTLHQDVYAVGEGDLVEHWDFAYDVLPTTTDEDNGKIPVVSDGMWSLIPLPSGGTTDVPVAGSSTTKLDFTNWANGSFVERLDDGTEIEHIVSRDSAGVITAIGGIEILGVG